MPGTLDTTNTMLAVIAAVMVLQGLILVGLGVAGWKIYRLSREIISEIDEKRIKPIAAKVDGLMDRAHQLTDRVHHLTERVQKRADRVEAAIDNTMGRVNNTATGMTSGVADTVHRVSNAVTGLRAALVNALTTEEGNGQRHHSRFAHDSAAPAGTGGQLQHDETRDVREGGF